MKRRQSSTWVVAVRDSDSGDVFTYGPYTRDRAEQIEAALERYFEGGGDLQPLVSSYPLSHPTIPELKEQWSEYKGGGHAST